MAMGIVAISALGVLLCLLSLSAVQGSKILFPEGVTQHYGYLEANAKYGVELFYWAFESQNNPATDPVVLWLTGGPGCSSELALFFENGPYTVNSDLSLTPNPYSWNKNATLIYVDQPGGTGFSYVKNTLGYATNETQVSNDMYTFLQAFFGKYPQYQTQPFFVTGESYGGHYVTAISRRIQVGIHNNEGIKINMKGLAIGNGWVDPLIQYGHYADFARGFNLISASEAAQVDQTFLQCQSQIENKQWNSAFSTCGSIVNAILDAAGNINPYNVKEQCQYPPLCYNMQYIGDYLNQPAVRAKLGVGNAQWSTCDGTVYSYLEEDFVHSFRFDFPYLLSEYRVFIYEGVNDLMCNYYGVTAYLDSLKWDGHNEFVNAKNTTWTLNGNAVGNYRTAKSLTYLNIFDAGHMVPHDKPAVAYSMLEKLLTGTPF